MNAVLFGRYGEESVSRALLPEGISIRTEKRLNMNAQERQQPKDVMVVVQCEQCYGTLQADGSITWCCDALHPEVLAQMDKRERRECEREDESN